MRIRLPKFETSYWLHMISTISYIERRGKKDILERLYKCLIMYGDTETHPIKKKGEVYVGCTWELCINLVGWWVRCNSHAFLLYKMDLVLLKFECGWQALPFKQVYCNVTIIISICPHNKSIFNVLNTSMFTYHLPICY